jgi:hypothetical protein
VQTFTFEYVVAAEGPEPPGVGELRMTVETGQLVLHPSYIDARDNRDGEEVLPFLPAGTTVYLQWLGGEVPYAHYIVENATGHDGYGHLGVAEIDAGNTFDEGQEVALVALVADQLPVPGPQPVYATVNELALLLRLNTPTEQQSLAMERVLEAAAQEIDWELGYTAETPAPNPPPALVVEVNLERAVEHWRQSYSPFGVIAVGAESEPIVAARNSWYRHHLKLAPLKAAYGVA